MLESGTTIVATVLTHEVLNFPVVSSKFMLWSGHPGKVIGVAEFVISESEATAALSKSTPWVVSVLLELIVQLMDNAIQFSLNTVQWSVATCITAVAASEKNGVGVTNDVGVVPVFTVPSLQDPVRWIVGTSADFLAIKPVVVTKKEVQNRLAKLSVA